MQTKSHEKTASHDLFDELPLEFRPKDPTIERLYPEFATAPHLITAQDDLPMTDSGYWLQDNEDSRLSIKRRPFTQDRIQFLVPPPHGWCHYWLRSENGFLSHIFNQRIARKLNDFTVIMARRLLVVYILESGIPAWTSVMDRKTRVKKINECLQNQTDLHSDL